MSKEINLKKLKMLRISDGGKITDLEGRVVNAIPIGKPFVVELTRFKGEDWTPYNIWDLTEKKLEQEYLFPYRATAYVWGDAINNMGLVHNPGGIGLDQRIVPIQPYKIVTKRGIKHG